MATEINLVLGVLDHQIRDLRDVRVGRVDDLELELTPGREAFVVNIVCGPDAWRSRIRVVGRLLARLAGGGCVQVPWAAVRKVDVQVHLRRPGPELQLDCGDERLRPWVAKVPGAEP